MPAYKLKNFNPVKSVNGKTPDKSGNVTIISGTSGSAYNFTEEIFLTRTDSSFTLTRNPITDVPLTVTVNGLVFTKDDFSVAGNVVTFPEGSVGVNDIVRIMYAYGG